MQGSLLWVFRSRKRWKKGPLPVSFDGSQGHSFHTPMAAAVIDGRDVPLLSASYKSELLDRRPNNLKEGTP
jgi:hypothetical protein